jgi:hypothetical protein
MRLLAAGACRRYHITVIPPVPPGSVLLRSFFYLLPGLIVLAAALLVRQGARAVGDRDAAAAAMQRRFLIVAAAWIAAVSAAAYSGVIARPGPPPPMMFVFAGIVMLGIGLARSRTGDRLARGLPLAVLVGFQAFRLPLELAMHRAHTEGLMPVQMSYSGLNFDIVTGSTAAMLAVTMAVRPVPLWIVTAWNWLGLGLLINIMTVALLSTPTFARFGQDRLNVWVFYMPYVLLPAVMVLAALAGHLVVFRALSFRAASRPDPR